MAKLPRHRSNLVLSLSLALLPWLGCSPGESPPTDIDAGTSGTAGTHAGGSTGAAGHAGAGGSGGSGGSIGAGSGGTGTAGTTGSAGSQGAGGRGGAAGTSATGTTGGAGTTGAAGAPATTGAAGAPATTGTAGAPATTGAAGAPATTGAAGAPATTGAGGSGVVVTTGTAGTTGTTGAAGHPATTGAAGAPATTGAAGAPATTGAAGAPATTGAAGAPGTAGTTGTGTAGTTGTGTAGTTGAGGTTAGGAIKNVFVIAMENEPASAIYGDKNAPYLNGLMAKYAHATAFTDPLPDSIPSEPHYVWMEAGTNKFSDATFTDDSDPDASNSTKSTAHLTTQMMAASPPVSWMGAMEGLDSSTGACPVSSSGFYVAKHDPFIFFQDIAGTPPSKSSALCGAHHKAFTSGQALVQGTVAQYNFISPNVCNDMHGDPSCPSGDPIAIGDAWLAANLPPLIDYVNAHSGVIFIVWDEPEGGSPVMPFFAIGPGVKPGYTSSVTFTHSSLVKTVEEIFGLPILPTVAGATDFADLFQPGALP